MSFWDYLPQQDPPQAFDAADLAALLVRLHALRFERENLADWEFLSSLDDALQEDAAEVLSGSERRWLIERLASVRDSLRDREWQLGSGLVHGDAWLGNLMTGPAGPVLGDWDRVAWGPREVDLVPTWHATRRYGRDPSWTERFVAVHGYDLATSPLFDDLMAMRDLAQLPGPLRAGAALGATRQGAAAAARRPHGRRRHVVLDRFVGGYPIRNGVAGTTVSTRPVAMS